MATTTNRRPISGRVISVSHFLIWLLALDVAQAQETGTEAVEAESDTAKTETDDDAGLELTGGHMTRIVAPTKMDTEDRKKYTDKGHKVSAAAGFPPFYSDRLADPGIHLPEPWGLSLIGVHNEQGETITDIGVSLNKGANPPAGEPEFPLPFVGLDNVVSDTNSFQIKDYLPPSMLTHAVSPKSLQ